MPEEASDSDTIPDRRENCCYWKKTEQEATIVEKRNGQEAGDKTASI